VNIEPLAALLREYRYWLLVPVSMLEGPGIAFLAGALSALGYFNPFVVFGVFLAKDLTVDGFFYALGRAGRRRPLVERLLARARVSGVEKTPIRDQWNRHTWRTMIIAKLSWGLSPALLAVAGIVSVPPKTFFRSVLGVAAVQYSVLVPLGYYFGQAIQTVSLTIRVVGYAMAGLVLVLIAFGYRRAHHESQRM
jgi:membrane protein DedA with SNARE-associated domain